MTLPRGPRVGEAYVEIRTNFASSKKDIEAQLAAEAEAMEKAGQQGATRYNKGFKDELEKNANLGEAIVNAVERDKGKISAAGSLLGDDLGSALRDRLNKQMTGESPEFIDALARNLETNLDEMAKRGALSFTQLDDGTRQFTADLRGPLLNAEKAARAEMEKMAAELEKMNSFMHGPDLPKWAEGVSSAARALDALNKEFIGPQLPEWTMGANNAEKALHALHNTYNELKAKLDKDNKSADSDNRTGTLGSVVKWSKDAATGIDKFATSIGKAFGAGSRNNFFNIIGSSIGNLVGLTGLLPKAAEGVAGLASKMGDASDEASNMTSSVSGILPKLAQLGGTGIGGIIGVSVLIEGLIILVGPLVSLVWGLVGALVALTGAVATGLIGALAGIAPLLLAAAAGFGVLFLAISGQSQASKTAQSNLNTINKQVATYQKAVAAAKPGTTAYKNAVDNLNTSLAAQHKAQATVNSDLATLAKPLTNFVTQARTVAQQHLFANAKQDAKDFSTAFGPLLGLVAGIADAIGKVVDGFAKASKDPDFLNFIKLLGKDLPAMIVSLGDSAVKFGDGFGRMFQAMLPYGQRLAGAIDTIATKFSNWADSAKGQSAIHNFLSTAWQDAKKLWDIIVNLGKVIGDVFFNPAAVKTGGGFLDSINSSLANLDKYLKSPQGREALTKWFGEAKQVIHDLGPILKDIVALFDYLDSPQSRKNLQTFFTILNGGLKILPTALQVATTPARVLFGIIRAFPGVVGGLKKAFDDVDKAFMGFAHYFDVNYLAKVIEGWGKDILHWIEWPFVTAYDFLLGHSLIPDLVNGIVSWFGGLPGKIAHALAGVPGAVAGPLISAAGTAYTWANRIWNDILNWVSRIPGDVARAMSGVPGTVGNALAAAAGAAYTWANRIWNDILTWVGRIPGDVARALGGIPGAVGGALASAAGAALSGAQRIAGDISGAFGGVVSGVSSAFEGIWSSITGWLGNAYQAVSYWVGQILGALNRLPGAGIAKSILHAVGIPGTATGGLFLGPQVRLLGEAGPEAVVPLDQPLSMVDPAVRALSALAQGKALPENVSALPAQFSGGTYVAKQLNVAKIEVTTPVNDTVVVAQQVLNRLVSAGYS
jgi:hypothetical protein